MSGAWRWAVLGLAALASASCEQGPRVPLINDPIDPRPTGVRYIDYLTTGGGSAKIQADIVARRPQTQRESVISFTGDRTFDPYNAPVLSGSRAQRAMRDLKECLLATWPGEKPAVELIIGSGLRPGGSALPNQLSINIGLLVAENIAPEEIASVVAHELGHVLLDHYERYEIVEMQKDAAKKLAGAAILAAYASEFRAKAGPGGVSFFIEDEQQVAESALLAVGVYAATQIVAESVIESSWSRVQETEADRLGIDLIVNTGLVPYTAITMLERLEADMALQKTRLDRFETVAASRLEAAAKTADPDLLIRQVYQVLLEALSSLILDLWDLVDSRHPTPEQRIKEIDAYITDVAAVPVTAGSPCDLASLARAIDRAEVRNAARALQAAKEVDDLLFADDLNGARAKAREGLSGGLERHPVTRMAAYRAEQRAGNPDAALGHLERIRLDADTPMAIYTLLAGEYIVRGAWAKADRVLTLGESRYPPDFFFPARIQWAYGTGDPAGALAYLARCKASRIEVMYDACERVAAPRAVGVANDTLRDQIGGTETAEPSVSDTVRDQIEGLSDLFAPTL